MGSLPDLQAVPVRVESPSPSYYLGELKRNSNLLIGLACRQKGTIRTAWKDPGASMELFPNAAAWLW
jgi:hypothetical protein